MKWIWLYYSRGEAISEQQRLQDIENEKALFDYKGIAYTDEDFIDFIAGDSVSMMMDEIVLDKNNFVEFN